MVMIVSGNANHTSGLDTNSSKPKQIEVKIMASTEDLDQEEEEDTVGELTENLLSANKISKDDFVFQKVVGRGSFGKVYMVKKKDKPDEVYALKVLDKGVLKKRNLLIKT